MRNPWRAGLWTPDCGYLLWRKTPRPKSEPASLTLRAKVKKINRATAAARLSSRTKQLLIPTTVELEEEEVEELEEPKSMRQK